MSAAAIVEEIHQRRDRRMEMVREAKEAALRLEQTRPELARALAEDAPDVGDLRAQIREDERRIEELESACDYLDGELEKLERRHRAAALREAEEEEVAAFEEAEAAVERLFEVAVAAYRDRVEQADREVLEAWQRAVEAQERVRELGSRGSRSVRARNSEGNPPLTGVANQPFLTALVHLRALPELGTPLIARAWSGVERQSVAESLATTEV